MRHRESKLQQHAVSWFRYQYPEFRLNFIAIPNGGLRGKREAEIMKAEGVTAGAADTALLIPKDGCPALFIEFKQQTYTWENGKERVHKTYQRPEQKEWQEAVERQGYRYEIVRTFDEFVNLIESYLGKKL